MLILELHDCMRWAVDSLILKVPVIRSGDQVKSIDRHILRTLMSETVFHSNTISDYTEGNRMLREWWGGGGSFMTVNENVYLKWVSAARGIRAITRNRPSIVKRLPMPDLNNAIDREHDQANIHNYSQSS